MLHPRITRLVRLAACLAVAPALAAASATLTGRLADERGQALAGARVVLLNQVSGFRQTVKADAQGRFAFRNLPFNEYHLEVFAEGVEVLHRTLELRSTLPVDLPLALKAQGATVAVEETLSLIEDHPSVHLDIDKSTIRTAPAAVQSRALESILLTTPGFIPDENGRFHFRGSHGQTTYVIDGIPVTDQLQATFSNSLDPSQVENLEVTTGGISAEHGGKPVAVLSMTTRSGLGATRPEGEVTLGLSRFRTQELGAALRGGSDRFGYFATAAASRSDRFLDPVNFENLHNTGRTRRAFARFDWILGERDTLRASVSGGRTDREVPNLASQQAAGMDARAGALDLNVSLGWNHLFSASANLEAALYHRSAGAELRPTRELQEGFAAGGPDLPVWVWQERRLDTWGAQISATQRFGQGSTVKAGLQAVTHPIRERFGFALTETGAVDPQSPLYAFTPEGGGAIFRFDDAIQPSLASGFVQTDLHLESWFLAIGLRYDRYTLRGLTDDLWQPRLGVSFVLPTSSILRASYDRLLIVREHENLALSTSRRAAELGEPGAPAPRLRPETQHSFTLGFEHQFGKLGRLMLDAWERRSMNPGDNAQFLNTGILFPVSAARGIFRGADLRVDLTFREGLTAYLSLGKTRAIFEGPLSGGLQLEPSEAAPGERFLIDHDQKLAAQWGLRFENERGFAQVMGRYDSGLVGADPAEAAGNPDLDFGIPFVRLDSEGTWRVKSRTTWNLSLGRSFSLGGPRKLELGADLLNAFNAKGLYNFLSVFGGTHVIPPRTWAVRVKYLF